MFRALAVKNNMPLSSVLVSQVMERPEVGLFYPYKFFVYLRERVLDISMPKQ
jgi:hypothetical protein